MKTVEYHPSSAKIGVAVGAVIIILAWAIEERLETIEKKALARIEATKLAEKALETSVCFRKKIDSYTLMQGEYGPMVKVNCWHKPRIIYKSKKGKGV